MENFVTDEQLADFLDVTSLTAAQADALTIACEAVRRFLDQNINLVEDLELHKDGVGPDAGKAARELRLPQRPVRMVSEVRFGTDIDDEDPLDEEDWVLRGDVLKLIQGFFPLGIDNVHVKYDAGYDVGDPYGELPVPADIRYWTCVIARRFNQEMGEAVTEDIMSETIGSYSYTKDNTNSTTQFELLPAEKAGLSRVAIRKYV